MCSTGSAVASPSNVDAARPQKSRGASFANTICKHLAFWRVVVLSVLLLLWYVTLSQIHFD